MNNKQNLGQFFTTNSQYIVGNLLQFFPTNAIICDPFAGNWDLLNAISQHYTKIAYDIEPQNSLTIQKNTLLNPPDYQNHWIITNPPYLARNKNNSKLNNNKFKQINQSIYEKYQLNDLYKIAIETLMNSNGGIIILPLNFFCEEHSSIRNKFLQKFQIKQLNIFEEQVFDDTTYTVCSFFFERTDSEFSAA